MKVTGSASHSTVGLLQGRHGLRTALGDDAGLTAQAPHAHCCTACHATAAQKAPICYSRLQCVAAPVCKLLHGDLGGSRRQEAPHQGVGSGPTAAPSAAPLLLLHCHGSPEGMCGDAVGHRGDTKRTQHQDRGLSCHRHGAQDAGCPAGRRGQGRGGCWRGIVNLLSYTAAYHCATVIP